MKKLLFAGLPALMLAVPSQAHAWGNPTILFGTASFFLNRSNTNFNISLSPGGPQAGPWYQYWPYEAHFQTPAPTGYPYWSAPLTAPMGFDPGMAAGGYPNHAPAYWYGP